jgi:hypothetical protein
MRGFRVFNQGIPRIICLRPRLTIISSRPLVFWKGSTGILVFHRMVPFLLVEPSTLYTWIGFGSRCKGKLAKERSPMSRKFPVSPESIRAEVSTIWSPTSSFTGKRSVLSFCEATSTCGGLYKDDVEATSCFKNPSPRIRAQFLLSVLRSTSGVPEEFRCHSFPVSLGN